MKKQTEPRVRVSNATKRLQAIAAASPSNNEAVRATARQLERLSALVERASMAAWLGKTYGGERDMYAALGYKPVLNYADLYGRYERGDIAKAVIDAPIDEAWRNPPRVVDTLEGESAFNKKFAELAEETALWGYFKRLHTQGAIGDYSVLMMGFADGNDPKQPLEKSKGKQLLFVMPYSQGSTQITELVTDPQDRRFGKPNLYALSTIDPRQIGRTREPTRGSTVYVHWSRAIHHAVDLLENDIIGCSKLRAPWNRLDDLDKVIGGASEAYWRGARPGIGVMGRQGVNFKKQTLDEMKEELQNYIHGFQSFLRMQNVDIEQLAAQAVDPSKHSEVLMTLIAATVRIPKRILFGTERGELASDQDERAWRKQVAQEQQQDIGPTIKKFVDQVVWAGALPEPKGKAIIDWPPLDTPGEKEAADAAKTWSEALATFFNSGAADFIPPDQYFSLICKMDKAKIEALAAAIEKWRKRADVDDDASDQSNQDDEDEDERELSGAAASSGKS